MTIDGVPHGKQGINVSALAGLRVLDLSRVMAGPFCAQILADLGADVVKVERPGHGDDTRSWGPPFIEPNLSAYFWSCNRGKRSVVADLASSEGQDFVRRLIADADILIENYKVGALRKYGLDYSAVQALNPRLIYCSITGFGQTGPYRQRPGYDTVAQAFGGLMSVTGHPDGHPGGGPLKVGVAVTDLLTATYSAVAILAAVNERHSSGRGQQIDMGLLDVQVASLSNIGVNYLVSQKVPPRCGNRLPTVYPSDAFRCADGDLMVIVGNDEQFRRLCDALEKPDLAKDVRFLRNEDRVSHAEALNDTMSASLLTKTVAEWCAALEAAQVPFSRINTLAEVFEDPQVSEREMVIQMKTASNLIAPALANPIHMSRTPPTYTRRPPSLGEHDQEVRNELLAPYINRQGK